MGTILLLSLLSGLSTPLGAWTVLQVHALTPSILAFILALASGVMVTVVGTELMPVSIQTGGIVWFILGCFSGMVLMESLARLWRPKNGSASAPLLPHQLRHTGRSIAMAIAVHDFPEGMAIGAGEIVHAKLGVVIALAIALHNMPEGMSIAAPLRASGMGRRAIMGLTLMISLVTPLGTLTPLVLGHLAPFLNAYILALASGAMIYVVAHDTGPESWYVQKRGAVLGFIVGVGLMLGMARMPAAWLAAII